MSLYIGHTALGIVCGQTMTSFFMFEVLTPLQRSSVPQQIQVSKS